MIFSSSYYLFFHPEKNILFANEAQSTNKMKHIFFSLPSTAFKASRVLRKKRYKSKGINDKCIAYENKLWFFNKKPKKMEKLW